MIGRTLTLQRRPGKDYVHGADLFDALTGQCPGWRRARLGLKGKLTCGGLVEAVAEARPGAQPVAWMDLETAAGPDLALQILPLPDHASPASTQAIPEDQLLAGSRISDLTCCFQHWNPSHPLGLTAVTAAMEVLWQLEPTAEWLLAELSLPNPEGWPPDAPFSVGLRQRRLKGKFASFTLEQGGRSVGSLHLAEYKKEPFQ